MEFYFTERKAQNYDMPTAKLTEGNVSSMLPKGNLAGITGHASLQYKLCLDKMATGAVVKTAEVIGKHIMEFKQPNNTKDPYAVPEIFIMLVNYFEEYP